MKNTQTKCLSVGYRIMNFEIRVQRYACAEN